ncbi:hypothetical protein TELCIR_07017 [Teladorsagia circumcincta]|uniref:Uncharacterized protein n=1 Tax=Teladorsagia circumcincta TaxID=45464 RepID=A0A2G9ULJ7_TELCI|nr:hypothetical protein TELCIR_07017 [Teladorsagia circumcincta]
MQCLNGNKSSEINLGSRLRVSDLRRWTKTDEDMVKQSNVYSAMMVMGLLAALTLNAVLERRKQQRPLPEIPVQSWDKYVELQKKNGREI